MRKKTAIRVRIPGGRGQVMPDDERKAAEARLKELTGVPALMRQRKGTWTSGRPDWSRVSEAHLRARKKRRAASAGARAPSILYGKLKILPHKYGPTYPSCLHAK